MEERPPSIALKEASVLPETPWPTLGQRFAATMAL
jgi:hypothetical protein